MSKQKITAKELMEVALEITLVQDRAMRVGLFDTRNLLHEAVKKAGWEIVEIINGEHPATEIRIEKK